MSKDPDPLASALAAFEAPPLDPGFSGRVLAIARAELTPATAEAFAPRRPRVALRFALVPAMVLSATAVQAAETAQLAARMVEHPRSGR